MTLNRHYGSRRTQAKARQKRCNSHSSGTWAFFQRPRDLADFPDLGPNQADKRYRFSVETNSTVRLASSASRRSSSCLSRNNSCSWVARIFSCSASHSMARRRGSSHAPESTRVRWAMLSRSAMRLRLQPLPGVRGTGFWSRCHYITVLGFVSWSLCAQAHVGECSTVLRPGDGARKSELH
jgi:hypothetical protein